MKTCTGRLRRKQASKTRTGGTGPFFYDQKIEQEQAKQRVPRSY
ncbi:MAG TPA: hypothetical protein VE244_08670 [Nitrososphaeraceae archaeon]|nr:hypothetical protein [Nitrososphaeraceae archaeon]